MSFTATGLSPAILKGVEKTGYTTPTEVQRQAIPFIIAGKDVMACAPTGTGKTAAFILPLLHRLDLSKNPAAKIRRPRALILTPTRELAQQNEDAIRTYGKFTNFNPLSLYGGTSINNQVNHLRRGVDIIVATPGRLQDHLDRRTLDLSHIEILVLDEADRMYDMGFIDAVRAIIAKIPAKRQTLLFSATMSREIKALMAGIQNHPQVIEIGQPFSPVKSVTQHFYSVTHQAKMDLLLHIIKTEPVVSMLVFSRTKYGADRIATRLEQEKVRSTAIHSNRSQAQRQRALDAFRHGNVKVLVATDVAARGIDVDGISHVVNFDTPVFAEDYIHRIGRTGRAAATGTALTFVSRDEEKHYWKILHLTGRRLPLEKFEGFTTRAVEVRPYQRHGAGKFAAAGQHPARPQAVPHFSPKPHFPVKPAGHHAPRPEPQSHRPERPSPTRRPDHTPHRPGPAAPRPVPAAHRPVHAAPRPASTTHRPEHPTHRPSIASHAPKPGIRRPSLTSYHPGHQAHPSGYLPGKHYSRPVPEKFIQKHEKEKLTPGQNNFAKFIIKKPRRDEL
jgi:ATP-dependent RNA helicase RhlE